jgi:hypothetical protein
MKYCLSLVGLYVATSLALAAWFFVAYPEAPPNTTPRFPPLDYMAATSTAAGFGCGIPAFLALAGFDGVRMRLRERRRIVSAAGFREPQDRSIEPFFGRIVSCGTPLTAPLTGRPCVMYHYAATHMSGGKSSTRVIDAEGYALSPCAVDTTAGRVDVRAYLEPEFAADPVEDPAVRDRLTAYQRTATLTQLGLDFAANYRNAKEYLLDDDGSVRYDHGFEGDFRHATLFEEHILQDGDEVAIFGMYSADRRAIVPDPEHELLHMARVRKGSLQQLSRGFVRQAIGSGLVGLLFTAITAGVVWAVFNRFLSTI